MMADDDEDDDSISNFECSSSSETSFIWRLSGSSDNDLQSMSSNSNSSSNNVDSISNTSIDSYLNDISDISSPLSILSNTSNSLESFPDTCSSASNNLQSPSNSHLPQSIGRSVVVDNSLSTEHSDSLCLTNDDKGISTAKDQYKSLEEAERSLGCDLNKFLELRREFQQNKALKILKQSKKNSENKSEKGVLKSENVTLESTKAGTRQEHHVTNSINSSIVQKGSLLDTELNKNGTSFGEEEPNSLLSMLEGLDDFPEEFISSEESVVRNREWLKIVSSDIAAKSAATDVSLNKCKVLLSEGVTSQDDGAIETLEDLLAAKTKSRDLEHKTPDMVLFEKSALKSVFDVDFSKYMSDVSKKVCSFISQGVDRTYNQHFIATNDQVVMHATLCFDDLQYAPGNGKLF